MTRMPLIGVTACRQQLGKYDSHTVGDKYVEAAAYAGLPLVLPARSTPSDPHQLLEQLAVSYTHLTLPTIYSV